VIAPGRSSQANPPIFVSIVRPGHTPASNGRYAIVVPF
jgi:hypothetical protein